MGGLRCGPRDVAFGNAVLDGGVVSVVLDLLDALRRERVGLSKLLILLVSRSFCRLVLLLLNQAGEVVDAQAGSVVRLLGDELRDRLVLSLLDEEGAVVSDHHFSTMVWLCPS